MACIVMLELIQQIEQGKKISLLRAIGEALFRDSIKVIPIAIVWGYLWLTIAILEGIVRNRNNIFSTAMSTADGSRLLHQGNPKYSSGVDGYFGYSYGLGFEFLKKLVRMLTFMALPAVAWENKGPFSAFIRSLKIYNRHRTQFLLSYTLTFTAFIVMAVPLIILFVLHLLGVALPAFIIPVVIIYIGFIWSLNIYLEQIGVGLLYLWHMKWEKNGKKGELYYVDRPDLFDEIHELK